MIPDTEDSRNSMQIFVCEGKLQSGKKQFQLDVQASEKCQSGGDGGGWWGCRRVHSSQQHKQIFTKRIQIEIYETSEIYLQMNAVSF